MDTDYTTFRYAELRKYCKSLGLPCLGKKEQLLELIDQHFKKNGNNQVNDEVISPVAAVTTTAATAVVETPVENSEAEVKPRKGRPRKSKVVKATEEPKPIANQTITKTPKRIQSESPARRQVKILKTPPQPHEPIKIAVVPTPKRIQSESPVKRVIKGQKAPEVLATLIAAPLPTPKRVQSESPVKKLTKIKESVKFSVAPTPERAQSGSPLKKMKIQKTPLRLPTAQTPKRIQSESPVKRMTKTQQTPKKIIEETSKSAPIPKKTKGRAKKKSPKVSPKAVAVVEATPVIINEVILTQPLSTSTQITQETKITAPKVVKQQIESSLLTNDESSKNLNITNDITKSPAQENINTQSARKKRPSSCPNRTQILDATYEKGETATSNTVEYNNPQKEEATIENKRPIGARIVKPVVNGVEVKETVAGPRIIKPPVAEEKIKEQPKARIAKPDFKAIHKKMEEKMESIDDYNKRKNDRHQSLSAVTSTVATNGARIVKAIPTINASPITKVSEMKKKVMPRSPSASAAVVSGIPTKIAKPPQVKPAPVVQAAPTTPKTPASAVKARRTPPASAIRKVTGSALRNQVDQQQQYTFNFQHVSRQMSNITNNNLNTSNLQSSAFSRRKSFDIGASLAKPLKYQPHQGRIKPIAPVATQQQQQQMRRQSILLNKNSKADLLHDQIRTHSGQNDDRAKINQLKSRAEKRIANQMQRRGIENNTAANDDE